MNALALMLYATVVAALMCVVGFCLEQLLVAVGKPRRCAWCLALTLSVIVPLGALVAPRGAIATDMPMLAIGSLPGATDDARAAGSVDVTSSRSTLPGNPLANLADATRESFARLAGLNTLWTWFVLVSLCIVPSMLLRQWMQLRARQQRWRRSRIDAADVLVSDDFGPAVIGTLTPRIVVPSYVFALDATKQHLVLAHEREHLRAHDGRLSLAMILLVALAPWNLLLWWQYARLRVSIELDCDARVLASGEPARAYGTLLIEMAARMSARPRLASALVERFAGSLRERIESISTVRRRVSPWRTTIAGAMAVAGAMLIVGLPSPVVSQQASPPVMSVQSDSTIAIEVMMLNRQGKWADAESLGSTLLESGASIRGNGGACAVLIGVTYAQALQRKMDVAAASMARFDRECATAVFADFFPGESSRVRRIVAGENPNAVYGLKTRHVVTDGGATDMMMLNRAGRHEEAEQIGLKFLASPSRTPREPEVCAVLISVTYAQHRLRKFELAKRSMQRFDSECANVMYLDWFPGEADRVRTLVGGGSGLALQRPTL